MIHLLYARSLPIEWLLITPFFIIAFYLIDTKIINKPKKS